MEQELRMTTKQIIKHAKRANDDKEDDLRLKYHHIAIVLKGRKPIVIGVNKAKSHPAIKKFPYGKHESIHAELDACIKLGMTDCSDYTMFVVRIRKDGSLANSKPCKGCQFVLNQLNFKKVIYSADNGIFEEL